MTEKAYRDAIEKATKSLGVYRVEFTRARVRLAKIYCRIEQLQKALEAGDFGTVAIEETKHGETLKIDPRIVELDRLNDQALSYEKALGLTADGAKKLNENLFSKTPTGTALAGILRVV